MSSTSAPEGSTKLWFSWMTTTHRDFPLTIHHPWDWSIYLHEWFIFMVNVGKYISPMDGIWVMISNLIITLPETNREGKTLKIGHSKRKFMGFQPSIFRGDLLVSGRVKQPKWGPVSTVCLSNRRTRTILEIESVPPNKKYRAGLNVSKVLYQVSKWNETSKHIKAFTLTNSVVVSFPPKTTQILNMGIQQIQEIHERWLSWSLVLLQVCQPNNLKKLIGNSQYSIITTIFTHTFWLVSLDFFNFPSWLCNC